MNIIFLDVDGVLNSKKTSRKLYNPTTVEGERRRDYPGMDPVHVALLNEIIEKSGARVVLSSTWRVVFGVANTLHTAKLAGYKYDFLDATPDGVVDAEVWPSRRWSERECPRGLEIRKWIERWDAAHPDDKVDRWVVLDDNDLRDVQANEKLVKTEWYPRDTPGGLQPQHVPEILKRLGVNIHA